MSKDHRLILSAFEFYKMTIVKAGFRHKLKRLYLKQIIVL